jgi:Domain of unknown function (DUF3576)
MQSASAWRIIFGAMIIGLVGCSSNDVEVPEGYRTENNERIRDEYGTVWGDGESLFQRGTGQFAEEDGPDGGSYAGIGVNAYLWRAALETINFLPLTQADPFGGVIITDWYSPERPDERFKLNVYILDTELRADAVKVAVFRQTGGENGWQDAAVDPQTPTNIEDSILTRARELRITALNASG